MLSRRGLITGLISLAAAPAIVRASSLMPVKAMLSAEDIFYMRLNEVYEATRKSINNALYADLTDVTRQAFVPRLLVQIQFPSPTLRYLMERPNGR